MSRGAHRPTRDDVLDAAARLGPVANHTPVMTSRTLDARAGCEIFVKCENFQRAGTFKFRGAYNAIARLSDEARSRGILTYSSGNHAQALALVGKLMHVPTTVVMPFDAPRVKLDATLGYGAEVVTYRPEETTREELAKKIQQERGLTLVPPFDHADVVAGQGTAALELLADVGHLDVLLVPCGGGGLLAGSALAAHGTGCRVVGVEPEAADDATRSYYGGTLESVTNPPTIADGLRTPSLGRITWPLIRERVDAMITVTETEIVEAMRFYWGRMKLLIEPSGAVSLAAVLDRDHPWRGRRVGVLASGGNVDLVTACALLNGV